VLEQRYWGPVYFGGIFRAIVYLVRLMDMQFVVIAQVVPLRFTFRIYQVLFTWGRGIIDEVAPMSKVRSNRCGT
jgi:hypothetical protein